MDLPEKRFSILIRQVEQPIRQNGLDLVRGKRSREQPSHHQQNLQDPSHITHHIQHVIRCSIRILNMLVHIKVDRHELILLRVIPLRRDFVMFHIKLHICVRMILTQINQRCLVFQLIYRRPYEGERRRISIELAWGELGTLLDSMFAERTWNELPVVQPNFDLGGCHVTFRPFEHRIQLRFIIQVVNQTRFIYIPFSSLLWHAWFINEL